MPSSPAGARVLAFPEATPTLPSGILGEHGTCLLTLPAFCSVRRKLANPFLLPWCLLLLVAAGNSRTFVRLFNLATIAKMLPFRGNTTSSSGCPVFRSSLFWCCNPLWLFPGLLSCFGPLCAKVILLGWPPEWSHLLPVAPSNPFSSEATVLLCRFPDENLLAQGLTFPWSSPTVSPGPHHTALHPRTGLWYTGLSDTPSTSLFSLSVCNASIPRMPSHCSSQG